MKENELDSGIEQTRSDYDAAEERRSGPVTGGMVMFWTVVALLGLIGLCVLVSIILVLFKGS